MCVRIHRDVAAQVHRRACAGVLGCGLLCPLSYGWCCSCFTCCFSCFACCFTCCFTCCCTTPALLAALLLLLYLLLYWLLYLLLYYSYFPFAPLLAALRAACFTTYSVPASRLAASSTTRTEQARKSTLSTSPWIACLQAIRRVKKKHFKYFFPCLPQW